MEKSMSIVETIKSFLAPSSPAMRVVTVNSPVDYAALPQGFFNVVTHSGKVSLGYNGSFVSWNVGETVVDGGRRVTLSVPKSELPTVRLNFQKPTQDGAQHVGGVTVLDTDALEEDSAVVWTGQSPRSGIEWV
jgi:flagellar basal body rod protein FlgG